MGNYAKTTWVEGVTQVGPTNLNKLEQAVADATKQVSADVGTALDATTAVTNDTKRVVWRRTSDGSYVASSEVYESGAGATLLTVEQDRVNNAIPFTNTLVNGATLRRIIEAYSSGGNPVITQAARLILEAIKGGRASVVAEVKSAAAPADPSVSRIVIDDTGASDFVQVFGTNPAPGTILVPGLSNGWTHYAPGGGLRFWKDPLNMVHFEGECQGGTLTAGTILFNVAAAYRPTQRHYFPAQNNGASPATSWFMVRANGDVCVSDNFAAPTSYNAISHTTWPTF